MQKLELSNPSALKAVLKQENTRSAETRFLHRLHCALLVGHGFSCYQVAELCGENPRTIERWIHVVQEYGVYALKNDRRRCRASKVDPDDYMRINEDLKQDPRVLGYDEKYWCGRTLQLHLQHRFDIDLSVRQCQRMLKNLRNSI
jgi:transposase